MRLLNLFEDHLGYPSKLNQFIDRLNPEDIGVAIYGNIALPFEGFTEECWVSYYERMEAREISGVADIEKEIISDWIKRLPGYSLVDHWWKYGGEEGEQDVFLASFRNNGNGRVMSADDAAPGTWDHFTKVYNLSESLMEASATVTLYRGDVEEVDDFSLGRTDYDALVGPGIYLTDSRIVAKDYTVKGDQNVLAKSKEGGASDPRGFMKRQFDGWLDPAIGKLIEDFKDAIDLGSQDLYRRFWDDIGEIVGYTDQAKNHPRYQELYAWSVKARRYAMVYMFKKGQTLLWEAARPEYDQLYASFKERLVGTKMVKTVLDELVILPADKLTPVSVFEIPKDYIENTYRVDDPMPDWMLAWILRFSSEVSGRDLSKHPGDLRYNDPEKGEIGTDNFYDWIEKFKEYGQRFAWAEHNIGGEGENPTLMQYTVGTHGGQSIVLDRRAKTGGDRFWDALRGLLEGRGYVGFHYQGGTRTGTDTFTGGSPVKHNAYALWNTSDLKSFRGKTENVGIDATDPRLFQRFQFRSFMKPWVDDIKRLENRLQDATDIHNPEYVEALADEWIATGVIARKLGLA